VIAIFARGAKEHGRDSANGTGYLTARPDTSL
jgi:hypothetical protein